MSKQLCVEIAGVKLEITEVKGRLATYNSCLDKMGAADQQRDVRVETLESTAQSLDKTLTTWKPKVESSLSAVKLELSKLNTFFDRDARSTTNPKSSVLPLRSASTPPSPRAHADGPNGLHVDNNIRDYGFGKFTQIHAPVKGTIPDPQLTLQSPDHHTPSESNLHSVKPPVGHLPKLDFPKFDGDHPKLWQLHCESYFKMYSVESSVWVKVATMHFEGAAAHWLQSVDHKIRSASWSEVCSWIHDQFGRDQHESLIR
jgi:hypothetical protein